MASCGSGMTALANNRYDSLRKQLPTCIRCAVASLGSNSLHHCQVWTVIHGILICVNSRLGWAFRSACDVFGRMIVAASQVGALDLRKLPSARQHVSVVCGIRISLCENWLGQLRSCLRCRRLPANHRDLQFIGQFHDFHPRTLFLYLSLLPCAGIAICCASISWSSSSFPF